MNNTCFSKLMLLANLLMFIVCFSVSASNTDLIVRAKGSKAHGIYAHFTVIVNDLECGEKYTSSAYKDYCFCVPFSKDEIKSIKIVFDNDHYVFGEDRNLYIENIVLGSDPDIFIADSQVKYICINGEKLEFNGMMGWDGALIFDLSNQSASNVI